MAARHTSNRPAEDCSDLRNVASGHSWHPGASVSRGNMAVFSTPGTQQRRSAMWIPRRASMIVTAPAVRAPHSRLLPPILHLNTLLPLAAQQQPHDELHTSGIGQLQQGCAHLGANFLRCHPKGPATML